MRLAFSGGRILMAAAVAGWALVPAARAGGAFSPRYAIHDLGSLGGNSTAGGISDNGRVVGSSRDLDGVPHAFHWDEDAGMRNLGVSPEGGASEAAGVNNQGQVAGTIWDPASGQAAFCWSADRGLRMLGTLGGQGSFASAINSRGVVVGGAQRPDGSEYPFLWTEAAGMRSLGGRRASPGEAYAVNRLNQVAGAFETRSFLWDERHGFRLLASGGTSTSPLLTSLALGLNDAGAATGADVIRRCSRLRCFTITEVRLWRTPRRPVTLSGRTPASGSDINNRGVVVGRAGAEASSWAPNGTRTPLQTLLPGGAGWSLTNAQAINEPGQIVGAGRLDGAQRVFLLTPVTWRSGADLALTLIPDAVTYPVGGAGRYSVRVTCYGPQPAAGVTVIQELAADTPLVAATPSAGDVTHDARTLTWSVGDMVVGTSAQLVVEFTVGAPVDFTSTARVESPRADPYAVNNAASAIARGQAAGESGLRTGRRAAR